MAAPYILNFDRKQLKRFLKFGFWIANIYVDNSCFYIKIAFLLKKQWMWLYYLIERRKLN